MTKPLPVGIQTFAQIVEGGFLYVDKTQSIYDLIQPAKGVYFLSRPRRFGKSLLVSTLAEVFAGNRDLFQGLWLYASPYAWEQHPVIRIDFSLDTVKSAAELELTLVRILRDIGLRYGVTLDDAGYQYQFQTLIRQLAATKPVVILIDEYDKPILDNIDNSTEAQRIRDVLKGFYTVIKGMDQYTRFVLLTGISKFSRVGVFSGLNNLKDISMDDRFATLPGITQTEMETYFQTYLPAFAEREGVTVAELLVRIKQWYNGFRFSKRGEAVYNPFSLLLLFDMQDFRNYWFESGTPTFLLKLIKERNYDIRQIETLEVDELAFSTYEIEKLTVVPLLYQAGYLTIKEYDRKRSLYKLYYPNYEVENAFLTHLLGEFSAVEAGLNASHLWQMIDALQQNDLAAFFATLNFFFARIPYDIQLKQEKYYQTIFYLIFTLIGLRIDAEVRTNHGRIDAVIELAQTIFLFEFKLDGDEQAALDQMKANAYVERYQGLGKTIQLIGVNFSTEVRGVTGWKVESVAGMAT
ncbi:MAG: AAA family ATPase [Caldilineaceae bacterium]